MWFRLPALTLLLFLLDVSSAFSSPRPKERSDSIIPKRLIVNLGSPPPVAPPFSRDRMSAERLDQLSAGPMPYKSSFHDNRIYESGPSIVAVPGGARKTVIEANLISEEESVTDYGLDASAKQIHEVASSIIIEEDFDSINPDLEAGRRNRGEHGLENPYLPSSQEPNRLNPLSSSSPLRHALVRPPPFSSAPELAPRPRKVLYPGIGLAPFEAKSIENASTRELVPDRKRYDVLPGGDDREHGRAGSRHGPSFSLRSRQRFRRFDVLPYVPHLWIFMAVSLGLLSTVKLLECWRSKMESRIRLGDKLEPSEEGNEDELGTVEKEKGQHVVIAMDQDM